MSNRTSRRLHLGHPVAHVAFPMVRKTGSTPHRAAPTKKDQPERRACRGGLKQLSEHRRTPDPGENVPAIAEEHARIDQRGARELVGCRADQYGRAPRLSLARARQDLAYAGARRAVSGHRDTRDVPAGLFWWVRLDVECSPSFGP